MTGKGKAKVTIAPSAKRRRRGSGRLDPDFGARIRNRRRLVRFVLNRSEHDAAGRECQRVVRSGAAQESNLPSRGLHDRTGFEDPGRNTGKPHEQIDRQAQAALRVTACGSAWRMPL